MTDDVHRKPADPPIQPLGGTATWYESGPEPIRNDVDLAVLIARVGMASNALLVQLQALDGMDTRPPATANHYRAFVTHLATAAALAFEAVRLAQNSMRRLHELTQLTEMKEEVRERLGKLCAGRHPAAPFIDRARNQLVFHWDSDAIVSAVKAHGTNEKLVWLEADEQWNTVHRFAVDVLFHSLFPSVATATNETQAQSAVLEAVRDLADAMNLLTEFFTASVYGYMKKHDFERQTRHSTQSGVSK